MKTCLFIIEDDPDFGESLKSVLMTSPFFEVTGIAPTIAEAKAHMDVVEDALFLVDLNLPDGSAVLIMQHIRAKYPRAKILALSALGDEKHILSSIQAGAAGYLLKSEIPANLTQSIINLINGGGYLGAHASKILIDRLFSDFAATNLHRINKVESTSSEKSTPHSPSLTRKECEILRNVEMGSQAKVIADALSISIFTVNQHLRSVYRKLNVRNKMEAVQAARRQGLM